MAGFNGYGFCVQVLQGWVQLLQGWVQELQGYADDCPQAKKNPAQGPGCNPATGAGPIREVNRGAFPLGCDHTGPPAHGTAHQPPAHG